MSTYNIITILNSSNIINNIKESIINVYNNILNYEVLKTPWFIYIDEKKEFHKIYEGTAPEILNNGCGHFE